MKPLVFLLLLAACEAGGAGVVDAGAATCPLTTTAEVEAQVVLPKCGLPGDGTCHATGAAPPRMAEVGKIAVNLLDQMPHLRCQRDLLVSRADPEKSHLLAKIRATGPTASCSDGSNGGPRMPYQDAPTLTPQEAACLTWWVHEIAR